MSDEHLKQRLEIDKQANDSDIKEVDADRAASSSEYHEQHVFHDSRYWHAACRVRDCTFGFPDCKVGSYCCKAGWKNVLEEPFSRSRSLGMASRRSGSVTMLPSLLSNLTVSRTRSDPCIFGKDFLRITLPLPGEPGDSMKRGHGVKKSECGAVENTDEPMKLFGTETGGNSPVIEVSTPPFVAPCKRVMPKTRDYLDFDSLFDVQYSFDMEFSESFGVIISGKPMAHLGDTSSDDNDAASSPKGGVSFSFRDSRTPEFDDQWTWHPNERTQRNKDPVHREIQRKSKSLEHYLTSAEDSEMDQAEEEGLEEGYLVFEEHEDERLARIKDEDNPCDDSEEESMLYAKHDNNDREEELFEDGEINTENSTKKYKEDDIWSDEHFVSSQAKGFPPPISILANETHPGLPGHMPRTFWRSVKRDGRFVLQEVQAQPREFFRATRESGRLRLQLVRPDSDPFGGYMEAASKENSSGLVSVTCASGIESLAGKLSSAKSEEPGTLYKGDKSELDHTQEIDALQSEDHCWTSEGGAKVGVALDKDDPKGPMQYVSFFKECGSLLEGETQIPGQKSTETFGVRSPATVDHKEELGSGGRNLLTKVSSMTSHNQIFEESWRGTMGLDDTMRTNNNCWISSECQFQDLGKEKKGGFSELGKVDYKENPVSLSDVEAGMPSHTGVKQNIGQIDAGELTMERMGFVELCTKLDVRQVVEDEGRDMGNHNNVVVPHEEQFPAYQHPCFNSTYGFDSNLKALSPSQAFIPIQPAVR